MVQKHTQNILKGLPAGLTIGAGGSIAVTLLLASIIAYFLNREMLTTESAMTCTVIIPILSAAAGAEIAWMRVGHHKLLVCAGAGIVYYLLLLGCTSLFFGGEFQNMAITALAVFGGVGAVVLIGLKDNKNTYRMYGTKHRNRKLVQNTQRGN